MKIIEDRQEVLVGGALSVDAFTIKASAKAFAILSSSLYSNPLGAMIRELSTNAYDAHVDAGIGDKPFNITLPTHIEPTFKIRDFGKGMSHEQIMSVYTTFFESTKTNSNDMVGCLGLGSKSPFGVADSFTVTTYYNGLKTIYSAFINDDRIPSIAKFAAFPTDDPNGIEIEVAIKSDDFYTFNKEVNNQLKYFKVKPVIEGNIDFAWQLGEDYLYAGNGWKMCKGGGRDSRIIQGQIQYPIDPCDMGKSYDDASPAVRELLDRSVLFEVDIGTVNVAPSREAMTYDAHTCKNIIAAAERMLTDLPGKLRAMIENANTEYEARLLYYSLITGLTKGYRRGDIGRLVSESGEITWQGVDVSDPSIDIAYADIEGAVKYTRTYRGRFKKHNMTYSCYKDHAWEFYATPLNHTVWVFAQPGDVAVEARAKQYSATLGMGTDIMLYIIYSNLPFEQMVKKFGLSEDQCVEASTLSKVSRATPTTSKVSTTQEVMRFSSWAYNKTDMWKTLPIVDMNDLDGYYIHLDRFDVIGEDGKNLNDFKGIVSGAIELGIIKDTDAIYGLRTINRKKAHNLVNLLNHIKTIAPSLNLNKKYTFGRSTIAHQLSRNVTVVKDLKSLISDDSPMVEVLDAVIHNTNSSYGYSSRYIIDTLGLTSPVVDLSDKSEMMDNLYPMITQCGNFYFNAQIVATYILQMDLMREMNHQGTLPVEEPLAA